MKYHSYGAGVMNLPLHRQISLMCLLCGIERPYVDLNLVGSDLRNVSTIFNGNAKKSCLVVFLG